MSIGIKGKVLYRHDPCPEIKPILSLVVTTYNRETFVDGFLQSLKNQTLDIKTIELIIADDGSQDHTLDWIKAADLPCKILCVWQKNQGFCLASSRNNGLRAATTDLIVLTDIDSILDKHFLEEHYRRQQRQLNLLLCGLAYYLPKYARIPIEKLDRSDLRVFRSLRFRLKLLVEKIRQPYLQWLARKNRFSLGTVVSGINCSFRKSGLARGEEFDESFDGVYGDEDIEFFHRLYKAGCQVEFLNSALVFHRWHGHDKTRGISCENRFKLLSKHQEMLSQCIINLGVNHFYGKTPAEIQYLRLCSQRLALRGKLPGRNIQRRKLKEFFFSMIFLIIPALFYNLGRVFRTKSESKVRLRTNFSKVKKHDKT